MARTGRTDQMVALHAEGVRQSEIARRLGVSRAAVSAALRSRGVHDRPDRGYPDDDARREALTRLGSLTRAAEELGMPVSVLTTWRSRRARDVQITHPTGHWEQRRERYLDIAARCTTLAEFLAASGLSSSYAAAWTRRNAPHLAPPRRRHHPQPLPDDPREALRMMREEAGMTAAQMAAALQTPRQTYVQWESGARRVPGVAIVAASLIRSRRRLATQ